MSRNFDWQTWAPRLMWVVVLFLAAQYGLGLAIRSTVIRSAETAIGARVKLAHARVSLVDRQVVLRDLRVADPYNSNRNLFEADRCELDFEATPVFRKQAIIDRGAITGLRFGTNFDESGALPDVRPAQQARSIQWFNDEVNQRTEEWLDHLDRRFDPDLINQFESIKRTAAMRDRLPAQSAALVQRARELSRRASELHMQFDGAQTNPLRHSEYLQSVPEAIAALQREFAELSGEVERLPELVDADRRAIVVARRQDEQWLRNQLQMPAIDATTLTGYLLQERAAQPLDEVLHWLRFARHVIPAGEPSKPSAGQRGEGVLFTGCKRSPRLLVRALALQGTARLAGQPVELHGTLSDLAASPGYYDKPMQLRLTTSGSLPLVLQATISRIGKAARDELLVDCRGIVLPKAMLGTSENLRLALAPSVGTLSVSIILDGNNLTGDIQLVQKQVQIASRVGSNLNDVPLAAALDDTLDDVDALATQVSLSGTLDEPKCTLSSNLGPATAEALNRGLRRAADQHARKLIAAAQQRVDLELTQLERQMAEAQTEVLPQLAQAAEQLEIIAGQQKPPQRISTEHLGRRLPANSLFR